MIVAHNAVKPVDFEGLQIWDYTAGRAASSSLAVIQVSPGIRHRQAWSRRSDKYYYVIAGQLRFALDGDEFDLAVGDFCLVRQGQCFWYENRTTEVVSLLLVHTPSFELDAEVFLE